jgi:hypothetical protein
MVLPKSSNRAESPSGKMVYVGCGGMGKQSKKEIRGFRKERFLDFRCKISDFGCKAGTQIAQIGPICAEGKKVQCLRFKVV